MQGRHGWVPSTPHPPPDPRGPAFPGWAWDSGPEQERALISRGAQAALGRDGIAGTAALGRSWAHVSMAVLSSPTFQCLML